MSTRELTVSAVRVDIDKNFSGLVSHGLSRQGM